ncbi:MAG TPA: 30S ribosomal protein S6 [Candidatus Paceibacterota bacterium]
MKDTEAKREVYEVSFHCLPTAEEVGAVEVATKIKSAITERGGEVISQGEVEPMTLSYEMVKKIDSKNHTFSKSYFGWVKFELDTNLLQEIKSLIESLPEILRYLLVKTVRENTMPYPKAPLARREVPEIKEEVLSAPIEVEKKEISEEEIDKSIDALVVS